MPIKTILWDNGGVLLDSTFKRFRSQQAKMLGISVSQYKKLYKPLLNKMFLGNLSEKEMYRIVLKKLNINNPRLVQKLIKIRYSKLRVLPKFHKIMTQLEKKYSLHMLNNEYKEAMIYFKKHFNYFKKFKTITTSYQVRAYKPSRKIFQEAIKKIKLKPSEILFIDDLNENVQAARKLGFKAIYVENQNSTKLKKDLRKYKIIVK